MLVLPNALHSYIYFQLYKIIYSRPHIMHHYDLSPHRVGMCNQLLAGKKKKKQEKLAGKMTNISWLFYSFHIIFKYTILILLHLLSYRTTVHLLYDWEISTKHFRSSSHVLTFYLSAFCKIPLLTKTSSLMTSPSRKWHHSFQWENNSTSVSAY